VRLGIAESPVFARAATHGVRRMPIVDVLRSHGRTVLLAAGTYLAISCMTSAITRNQVVSFILSVVACLFLILAGFPPATEFLSKLTRESWIADSVAALSGITHFEQFQKGVLGSRDVIFFLSLIGFSLFTTGVILRGHRAG